MIVNNSNHRFEISGRYQGYHDSRENRVKAGADAANAAGATNLNAVKLIAFLIDTDTATIGYWHNKNGQALIETLDEGGALTNWLLDNFGNIFDQADFDEYGGSVGDFYRSEFFKKKLKGTPKVDAQFMAVAIATFATSSNLSNGSAVNFDFTVSDSGIGTTVVNVGSSGAAFGVADNTDMTIMALLLATNDLTGSGADLVYDGAQDLNNDGVVDDTLGSLGTLDDFEKILRVMANAIYTGINEQGDI